MKKPFSFEVSTTPLDRVAKKAQGVKDIPLKKEIPEVFAAVKKIQGLVSKLPKSDMPTEKREFEKRKSSLEEIVKECDNTLKLIETARRKKVTRFDVSAKRDKQKGKAGVQVGREERLENIRGANDRLNELKSEVQSVRAKVQQDLAEFEDWYEDLTDSSKLVYRLPKAQKNLLATTGNLGITLPKAQSFTGGDVVFSDVPQFLSQDLQQAVAAEVEKSVNTFAEQTAKNLAAWDREFFNAQRKNDTKKAQDVFDSINSYFDDLQSEIEPAIKAAAKSALDGMIRKKPVFKKLIENAGVSFDVKAVRCQFANFKLDLPDDSGSSDLTSSLQDTLKDLQKAERDYESARKGVADNYTRFAQQSTEISDLLDEMYPRKETPEAGEVRERRRREFEKLSDGLEESARKLGTALSDAGQNRNEIAAKLAKQNKEAVAEFRKLRSDASVNQRALQDVKGALTKLLKRLGEVDNVLSAIGKEFESGRFIADTVANIEVDSKPLESRTDLAVAAARRALSRSSLRRSEREIDRALDISSELDEFRTRTDGLAKA
ncbi:hypothetical protein Mal4_56230 [Maioricimonas rarisocia]|uniref:Uncharacterized protein n=1 Tax=Maioricimonas rarisocia TaxID=2528026 RepID=A0A517ZFJ6_9PLAN|nr:hypothetical protein [Maioricimonas rarisocia]QDU41258.1 hypothetical protein Mal4_56230 [Maioricimonas rarisocia]